MAEQLQRDVYPILLKPKSIYIANTSETLKTINVISTIPGNCRTIWFRKELLPWKLTIFFFQVQTEKSEHQISASRDQQ